MTQTEYAIVIPALIALIGAIYTFIANQNKTNKEEITEFRDDLLKRVEQQDAAIATLETRVKNRDIEIEALEKRIAEKERRNKELDERMDGIRSELAELTKKSGQEISNWRESYYLALNEYHKVKMENSELKKEIEVLRAQYEELKAAHEEVKSTVEKL